MNLTPTLFYRIILLEKKVDKLFEHPIFQDHDMAYGNEKMREEALSELRKIFSFVKFDLSGNVDEI